MNIPTRRRVIENAKARGKKIAAVFPIHYPRELFKAFNIHPVEVWGPPKMDTALARSHLQTYICSVVQSGLAFFLQGGLDVADFILVPHCCDSLQGLGSLLKGFVGKDKPIFTFYVPREKRKSDIEFLKNEIEHLFELLSEQTGYTPTDEELLGAILKEESIDRLMKKAYEIHAEYLTSSLEFYTMMRSREYLPDALFEAVLNEFIEKRHTKRDATPLLFCGVLPEPMEVLGFVDEVGGVVANDDFASLKRRIYPQGASDDPFRRMAERIVNSPPDAMRGSSIEERIEFIAEEVERSKAKGVVFYDVKFCEPEKFYRPIMKDRLKERGIGVLSVEVDINEPLPQQVKTRIAAFVESLRGVR